MTAKTLKSYRLDGDVLREIEQMQSSIGFSATSIIENAVRDFAVKWASSALFPGAYEVIGTYLKMIGSIEKMALSKKPIGQWDKSILEMLEFAVSIANYRLSQNEQADLEDEQAAFDEMIDNLIDGLNKMKSTMRAGEHPMIEIN